MLYMLLLNNNIKTGLIMFLNVTFALILQHQKNKIVTAFNMKPSSIQITLVIKFECKISEHLYEISDMTVHVFVCV